MLELFLALGLAALPAVLLIVYFYRLDSARPEPIGLIGKSVLYGFLAVLPAMVIEILLDRFLPHLPGVGGALVEAFLIAGLVEESVKLFFIRHYLWKRPEFDEAVDGIVYAVCVSLGFAFVENFLYTYNRPLFVLLLRSMTAVPLHALAAGTMGYYLGLEKLFSREKARRVPISESLRKGGWKKGLAWAVFIHGLYDFFLMTGTLTGLLVVPLLLVGFRVLRRLYRKALELDDEAEGMLYQDPSPPIL